MSTPVIDPIPPARDSGNRAPRLPVTLKIGHPARKHVMRPGGGELRIAV